VVVPPEAVPDALALPVEAPVAEPPEPTVELAEPPLELPAEPVVPAVELVPELEEQAESAAAAARISAEWVGVMGDGITAPQRQRKPYCTGAQSETPAPTTLYPSLLTTWVAMPVLRGT
jgi:hypothetical protein